MEVVDPERSAVRPSRQPSRLPGLLLRPRPRCVSEQRNQVSATSADRLARRAGHRVHGAPHPPDPVL